MTNLRYVIGIKPFLFEVSTEESIDIDTEIDFKFAKMMYNEQKKINDRFKGS